MIRNKMRGYVAWLLFAVVLGTSIFGNGQVKAEDGLYESSEKEWCFERIIVSPEQAEVGAEIYIKAETSGKNKNLQYKYVWMKNGWEQWGVLKDFSSVSEIIWQPEEEGKYFLYVDIMDEEGKIVTKSVPYEVKEAVWQWNEIDVQPKGIQKVGEKIKIKAGASGNTKGLQYKYVWMKNDWKEWGIIAPFSEQSEIEFTADKPGDYKFYVDIRDKKGNITTKTLEYSVMTDVWTGEGIETDLPSPQEKYTTPIEVKMNVSGEISNLKYKFVWMKDDWKEWGILQNFSKNDTAKWYPKNEGKYWLYVDVVDVDNRIITYKIPYTIDKVYWNFENIEISPQNIQKKGQDIDIAVDITGNKTGLQYKYVWMKDNWKEWGVIKNFSDSANVIWKTPEKSGTYYIYVDVKDRDGNVVAKRTEYLVVSQIWQHDGIDINQGKAEQVYRNIPVEANISGETEGLQYKYVWMKDNWKSWGVIRDFKEQKNAVWYPKEAGQYYIYSDVKDSDGRIVTYIQEYTVLDAPWKVDKIQVSSAGSFFVGDSAKVSVITSGETEGLKYKFVQKFGDDWSNWKVLQDFQENSTVTVDVKKAGNYTIYVDIMDQEGEIFEPVTTIVKGHRYESASASPAKVTIGNSTVLSPNISGNVSGAECKFVWMKDNWSEWGILKDYSTETSLKWIPSSVGRYYVYIDVRLNNLVKTQYTVVDVVKEKNGWYYEDGYKFYYRNDVKVEDVRSILGQQSRYEIRVNKQLSCVTVYAKDGDNGYIIPVVAFACSPGADTPLGTFYTQEKYRWHHLYGADGQFCTRITGHVLFHSPPYSKFDNHTLWPKEYNRLGSWASAGCVRLRSGDAKWIYDNCVLSTKVVIYNSNIAGPFSKPVYDKIPLTQTWDPTDPYV